MIRFRVAKVNEADLNIETLVNGADGIKQSANKLDTDGPQVRVEIDKLVGIFSNLAPDTPFPTDMQAQLTGLYGSLAAAIQHAPVQDFLQQASALDSQVSAYTDNVDEITRKLDAGVACEAPPADAAVQRIDSALQNAQYKVNNDSDLPKLAQICEASAKCIPLINQTRQLLEQLQIEAGQAGIEQARDAGCNVAGLETALDYYRTVRDAVNLLNNAKAQCRFQEGLDFAQKIPQSIQNNSYVASAMSELRAGLATQQQVEQLLLQATDALSRAVDLAAGPGGNPVWGSHGIPRDCKQADSLAAQADAFLAQAYQLAASSACLTARVDKYRGQYDQLKARKEPCVGTSDSNSGKGKDQEPTNEVPPVLDPGKRKSQEPTNEVPPSLDPGKGKNQEPTNEVPPSLDPGKGRNQVPTNEVPPSLDPGKGKNQEPTNEVPPSLDPGKGKNQEPTNEVPPSLDPGTRTASNRPPGENNPPPVGQGGNELPPGLVRDKKGNYKPAKGWEWENPDDPNDLRVKKTDPEVERQRKQERSERLGEIIGGIIRAGVDEEIDRERRSGSGNTGGGRTGGSGGTGGGNGSGGGGRPCNADEKAAFAQMTGSWKAYIMDLTIGGSCENASGTFRYASYCEGVDATDNPSTERINGTFTGRMQGTSLEVNWHQLPHGKSGELPAVDGAGSCRINGDGTLDCDYLTRCSMTGGKRQ